MSPYQIKIFAKDVDGAREEIFNCLRWRDIRVIYFDGWSEFGAAAVLRSMADALPSRRSAPELSFDKIIYIDCSEWQSRRAMQRAIAEELKLGRSVLDILDKQDEEDDFNGVDQGSRDLIESVAAVIYRTLTNIKFMMIFLNGTDDEVDVTTFGIPHFTRFRNNVMIWTFRRRFLLTLNPWFRSKLEDKLRYTDIVIYCPTYITDQLTSSQFQEILREEAATLVARNPCILDIDLAMVADCCLYELFLHYNFSTTNKFDWAAHASNYWICDGIIKGDRARDISKTLQREINWEFTLDEFLTKFMKHLKPYFLIVKDDDVYEEGPYRWIAITSRNTEVHGMQTIPAATSSFFLEFERSDHPPTLPNGLFEHSSKLVVLVLYCCAFNFRSPPFLKCHGLRFLGLDHCIDDKTGGGEDHTQWACFYRLWVLDLRYTDWNEVLSEEKMDLMTNVRELNIEGVSDWQYLAHLQGRLPNLQRLRTIKPTCQWEKSKDVDSCFMDKTRLEILDLSGNSDMKILPRSLSKASSLQVVVLDGCDGLENIGRFPPALQSFSFDGYGSASQWTQTVELPSEKFRPSATADNKDIKISKISLEGCTQLENMFLRGLPNLVELDLSGTAIVILDFKTMVVQVPRLKRLFLIGCKHLRAINPLSTSYSVIQPDLELLCIDTRAEIGLHRPFIDRNTSFRLQVHAVVLDARLALSIIRLIQPYLYSGRRLEDVYANICITSSPLYDGVVQLEATLNDKIGPSDQVSLQQLVPAGRYFDVLSMLGDAPMQAFPQPPTMKLDRHIEIAEGSRYVESELSRLLGFVKSVHVHDALIRDTPRSSGTWSYLRRCCVERCPKLDTVFPTNSGYFLELETVWAADLLMARCICDKYRGVKGDRSFQNLKLLQLRSCPRLQFVLPVWVSSFPSLEAIHIIHCSDLKHVFVLSDKYPEEIAVNGVSFPKLTTIHLHDLPTLRQICEVKMVAPRLEFIKIRGCWGLRRLPVVAARGRDEKKPTVEIEKDVWDALEWDGQEAGHHPNHFEAPLHSRYYKKKLPRVSFLR